MQSNEQIGNAAVDFIAVQFNKYTDISGYIMLNYIPTSVLNAEIENMIRSSEKEEAKRVVFELVGNTIYGPDGFSRISLPDMLGHYWGLHYQVC